MATAAEETRKRFFQGGAGTSGSGFGGRSARRVAAAPRPSAGPPDKNMAEFMAFGARKAAREAKIKAGDRNHARAMVNLGGENARQLATQKGGIDSEAAALAHKNALAAGARGEEYNKAADNRKLISDAIMAGAPVTPGMEGVYGTQGPFNPNLRDANIQVPNRPLSQKGYGVVPIGTGEDSNPAYGLLNKDTGEIQRSIMGAQQEPGAGGVNQQTPPAEQPADQAAIMSLAEQYRRASRQDREKLLRANPAMVPHLKRYLTSSPQQ